MSAPDRARGAVRLLWSRCGRGRAWSVPTIFPLVVALLAAVRAVGVVAATVFTHQVVDPDGPPKVWGKAVGDLDGDGKADLVVGGYLGGLYWYKNPGWGKHIISTTARIEEDLEVVDLDKDGRKDIVAITYGGVTWFRHTDNGWSAQIIARGVNCHDIEVVDLDGDLKYDIAGRDQMPRGDKLFLWRRQSPTSWVGSMIKLPQVGTGLLAVDLDRDKKPDLVIGKHWYKNNSRTGALSFTHYRYSYGAEQDAYIAAGKIDADNYVDLVVTPAHAQSGTHNVAWFKAPATTTSGWIRHVLQANVQPQYHFAAVADFDRDGDNDIATAMTTWRPIRRSRSTTTRPAPAASGRRSPSPTRARTA